PLPGLQGKLITGGRLNIARAVNVPLKMRPFVVTALPAGQRTSADSPIRVTFSYPMYRRSVESNFVVTPPIVGRFEWADDDKSFTFQHDAPFDTTTNYTVRILSFALSYPHSLQGNASPLDGNFNGIEEGSPADDFVWTFRFPVSNDNFANAQVLTNAS